MSKKSNKSDQQQQAAMIENNNFLFDTNFIADPLTEYHHMNSNHHNEKCCTKHCCLNLCKKFITFLISRIGLMIAMIGYVLAGGLIFEALESDNEMRALKLSEDVLNKMLTRVYKQIVNNSTRIKDDAFYYFLRSEIK
jgi:hypothetical protein